MYTVLPIKWEAMIYSQGQPSAKSSSTSSSTVAPWQLTAIEGASKFMFSIKAVTVNTQTAPILWSLPMEVGLPLLSQAPSVVWGLHWPQEHPSRQGPPSRVPPAVRHSAISQNPRGDSFGLAPLPSFSWCASSGESSDKADPKTSPRSHHSSSKRHQTLLCCFELQLRCHQGSPDL